MMLELLKSAPKARRAALLGEAIEALWMASTPTEIVRIIRGSAYTISNVDGVAFVLRDGDHCHYVDEDAIGPLWKGRKYPMFACISGHCMLNKASIVIPDIYADGRIPHDLYRPTFVKSLMMVPVRVEDPLAAVGYYWAQKGYPGDETIAFLEALAGAATDAITACARASF